VIDVCLLYNELDLLEVRLRELEAVVDTFVVLEGTETFAGVPKARTLDVTAPRWARWAGRLVAHPVPRAPAAATRWDREYLARDQVVPALHALGVSDTTLVLYSDVDEIPDAAVVQAYRDRVTPEAWVGFRPCVSYYYANLRTAEPWSAIALAQAQTVRALGGRGLRDQRRCPPVGVARGVGGWHLSWLGGVDAIRAKLSAWTHAELDTAVTNNPTHIATCLRERVDLFRRRRWGRMWVAPWATLPATLQADPARYAAWLLPEES